MYISSSCKSKCKFAQISYVACQQNLVFNKKSLNTASGIYAQLIFSMKVLNCFNIFVVSLVIFQQVSHNGERYGILVKHLEPSASSMSSYLKIRYKAQIYSITSTIEMEHPNKQLLLDIHLDK